MHANLTALAAFFARYAQTPAALRTPHFVTAYRIANQLLFAVDRPADDPARSTHTCLPRAPHPQG